MKNKYLTERERYQIETLYKERYSVKMIAERLGRCKATIYNELKRGMVTFLTDELEEYVMYDAYYAQHRADENSKEKGRPLKIGRDLDFVKYIEERILNDRFSPCAILADMVTCNKSFDTNICVKTVYNYIHSGVFLNVTEKNMIYNVSSNKKKVVQSKVALKNLRGRSIEERSKSIDSRQEFGHWEMDTVYSGRDNGKASLLVLTERKSRREIIRKMPDRTISSVVRALNSLELEFGCYKFRETFKTITCDNGMEFLNCRLLENSVFGGKRTTLYYCHPYSSSERGSNENCNKLIRRFIPKGHDISSCCDEFIQYIENWINNYPRKLFGYLSSNEYCGFCGI